MEQSDQHTLSRGDIFALTNAKSVALRYRIDFGTAGAVRLTLAPGAQFEVIAGSGPGVVNVKLEEASAPGIREV